MGVVPDDRLAGPMIQALATDMEYDQQRARQTAMLLSGAPQPAEFLVPAVNALLVETPGTVDPRIGASAIGDNGQNALLFGPAGPGDITVVAVEALGANPEASAQFASMGEDQVGALVFGSGTVDDYPDATRPATWKPPAACSSTPSSPRESSAPAATAPPPTRSSSTSSPWPMAMCPTP